LLNCRIIKLSHHPIFPFFSRQSGISAKVSSFHYSNPQILKLLNCRIIKLSHSSTFLPPKRNFGKSLIIPLFKLSNCRIVELFNYSSLIYSNLQCY
jgi:hypothetical protein